MTPQSTLIPWSVPRQHRGDAYNFLALEALRRAGDVHGRIEVLDRWLERLYENDLVVWYEEDDPTGRGWYLVPRRSWDDDIVRRPQNQPNLAFLRRHG